MKRTTLDQLQAIIARINQVTRSPLEPYNKDGSYTANVGNFHLDRAYGGYALHRMANIEEGAIDVFQCGHVKASELASLMYAFIRGLEMGGMK